MEGAAEEQAHVGGHEGVEDHVGENGGGEDRGVDWRLPVQYIPTRVGRSRSVIGSDPEAQIEFYRKVQDMRMVGCTWTAVHQRLGVNRKFLDRWRKEVKFVDPITRGERWSDEDLDQQVSWIMAQHPSSARGYVMMESFLRAACIFIPRDRLRASIRRVDPDGVESRRRRTAHRRVYSVPGPHHLWHVDGNHKLNRFNLVVHAGIDGFSRALIYAVCSDNNKAETALNAFLTGIEAYGCPSRVRTDRGGENVLIADFMLEHRGMGRGSIIAGRSTQNQRIERQWRDLYKEVLSFYRELFYDFETSHNINFADEGALFCLHYLFLNRINEDLLSYRQRWNSHRIRTEKNMSPNQMLLLNEDNADLLQVDEDYGVEEGDTLLQRKIDTLREFLQFVHAVCMTKFARFTTLDKLERLIQ